MNTKHKHYNSPIIHGVRRANNILITSSEFSSGIRPYKAYEDDEDLKILNTSKKKIMKKKVYISGKMSGLSEDEFKSLFKEAEVKLIEEGYDVVNPCEIDYIPEDYAGQFLTALEALSKCDAIYMLDNWEDSNGAKSEYWFAKGMGLKFIELKK